MRLLVIGHEAVDLFRELRMPRRDAFWVVNSCSVHESLQLVTKGAFDSVLISRFTEGKTGLEIASSVRNQSASLPIFLLGEDESSSELSPSLQLVEYISAAIDKNMLVRYLAMATQRHHLQLENEQLRKSVDKARDKALSTINLSPMREKGEEISTPELIGSGAAMREVRRKIAQVAGTDMSVMILGETGTGKDVVARALHHAGNKSGEYVKICCPTLPEQLLESELFGHEAGAFTGATQQKPGRLEIAANGSVFLDEITEMAPYIQAKLLEVLESKTFMRVGSTQPIEVELSFYAASNVPLSDLFDKKGFRRDLYYRLNQYCIEIPPLRDRVEDIPELIQFFLDKYARVFGHPDLEVSSDFMVRLTQHDWPGNVRELESVIRQYALTQDEYIMNHAEKKQVPEINTPLPKFGLYKLNERQIISEALTQAKWNRREAAKSLGMSYNTLRRRIALYELV